jgi:hypothetical protein
VRVPVHAAGQQWTCPSCGEWIHVPGGAPPAPPGGVAPGAGAGGGALPRYDDYGDPYALSAREREEYERLRAQQHQGGGGGGGEGNAAMGWLIFILIFGVGNVILYMTTGIFLIPIPQR